MPLCTSQAVTTFPYSPVECDTTSHILIRIWRTGYTRCLCRAKFGPIEDIDLCRRDTVKWRARLACKVDLSSGFFRTEVLFGGDEWPPNPVLIVTWTVETRSAADCFTGSAMRRRSLPASSAGVSICYSKTQYCHFIW